MDDAVFKRIEITGTSAVSIEDAVNNALAKAALSVRNLRWFEVEEVRGAIDENQVAQWQVSLKIGFALD